METQYWLMKTEPETFSFDDLIASPNKTTCWEGVRNYQARNLLRDVIKKGHKVFIYHSRVEDPAIVGIAEVVKEGYPDDTSFDPKSKYFDAKAKKRGINPWVMVDVKAIQRMKTPVSRSLMKRKKDLEQMMVLKKGARLSVQPVTKKEFKTICKLGEPQKV